jgi:uncharacterized protein (DUF849 family)
MLIKACLNGGTTRQQHPAVPLTPDELAVDARDAVRAGAGAIHVHPRDASGDETLEAAGSSPLSARSGPRSRRRPSG